MYKLKKLRLVTYLILIFSLTDHVLIAQSNFQEGYYISLENDTIKGLIDNRGEILNSSACIFKPGKSEKAQKFSPDEIVAYRFQDGKYYKSKTINTNDGDQQVFLEFLLDGVVNLYFFRDINDYFYLLETNDGKLLKLEDESKTVFVEGKGNMVLNSNRHINLLKGTFFDCMEIQPQISQTELTHNSLIKLTKNYHNYTCKEEICVVYEKKLPQIKVQVAPLAGFTISNFKIDGGFYSRFTYKTISNASFGFQVHTLLPRVYERISLQLDFLYMDHDIYGSYNGYYELCIKNSKFQPSLAVKYKFPKGKFRPSVAVGVATDYLLKPEFKAIVNNVPGDPSQEHELNYVNLTNQLWGSMLQLGCDYHFLKKSELFFNIKYVPTSGVTAKNNIRTKTLVNTLNFNLGYYL
jgi:hypothetical protein